MTRPVLAFLLALAAPAAFPLAAAAQSDAPLPAGGLVTVSAPLPEAVPVSGPDEAEVSGEGLGGDAGEEMVERVDGTRARGEALRRDREARRAGRLVPGGALLLSFDADRDGRIAAAELDAGMAAAFAAADADESGAVRILEQLAWADALPGRDGALANATRFDANLDRQVDWEEWQTALRQLAAAYADADGSVATASLRDTRAERRLVPLEEGLLPARAQPRTGQR